jgi:hypothetical protein
MAETEPNLTPETAALVRVWNISKENARAGIERGFTDPAALLAGVATVAHGSRGPLDLLTAHAIALEAIRAALAEARQ